MGTKRTPAMWRAFRNAAILFAPTQGAPTTSKGVSVPRPTETFVCSINATAGYSVAWFRSRKLGEGLTHSCDVESNQSPRIQPFMGTTVRLALMLRSVLRSDEHTSE